MSTPQPNDYVISRVKQASGKTQDALIKVKNVDSQGNIFGVYQKDPHIRNLHVEVPKDSIIANFGAKPPEGTAFGYNLGRLYVGAKPHKSFGDIYFFQRTPKERREELFDSLDRVRTLYKKFGIDIAKLPVLHEVHPKTGKYAGMYLHAKDQEKGNNRIHYYVDACGQDLTMDHIVAHENAHAIDYMLIRQNKDAHARWIKAYNGSIATKLISKTDNKTILGSFAGTESESVKDWMSGLDEELRLPAKYAMSYLRTVRGLSFKEIDTLMATGNKDEVTRLWPKVELDVREPKPLVTEYATKSPCELIAESISLHVVGTQIPEVIAELVEKSLRFAKINFKTYA